MRFSSDTILYLHSPSLKDLDMIRFLLIIFIFLQNINSFSQEIPSIHQQELEYYNSLGNSAEWYEENVNTEIFQQSSDRVFGCTTNKVVYGWHPYWVGSAYNNYDWDLLTHFSYFSYEVNPADGEPFTTHSWATSAAVDAALLSGVKVTLCVTLFGSSDLTNFLTDATAKQTLIDNLINLVQARGAHGVNIDFEGIPSSQTTNFANFMVSLSNQMHIAIPGSEVSTVLYAVDWSNVFNFAIMNPVVDYFIIMGYAYYYQGSGTTGPNDPLYHFGSTYNYTLSQTITNYVEDGCSKNKLVLGLPYYGYEWSTTSLTIPSSTTAIGVSKTYDQVKTNSGGYYNSGNHNWDAASYTDIFAYNNGTNKQCFIALEDAFRKRLEHVNNAGIAGIGIWALGYDDGWGEYWNALADYMTDCKADSCSGTIHDFGGPVKNYYDNEDYTWTIAPPLATAIDVSFSAFNLELNYDYLYIYDGSSTASPLIGLYTGTNSPGTFSTTSGAITFRFTSDVATVSSGFLATYDCVQDNTPPLTSVNTTNPWQTVDFTTNFTDTDDFGVEENFYNVSDFDGTEWRSNSDFGFFTDEFSTGSINPEWTSQTGTWAINSGTLQHTNEGIANSNIYADLAQDDQHVYLYNWQGEINGSGANRRAGIHFFCSDPTLDQRGDSYMVFWRVDQNKCQIYKSTGNSIMLMTDDDVVIDANVNYDFKILFDPSTGNIKAFLDDELVSEWTDPSPFVLGNSISPRSGNAIGIYDNFRVYKSRTSSELISIGDANSEIRYQNQNPLTPAGSVHSINIDLANNFSTVDEKLLDIDWTVPSTALFVNDGTAADIDLFSTPIAISGNWGISVDTHSDIAAYWYAVGTSSGASDIVAWTDNVLATSFTETGLSLVVGQTYFVSVKSINGASLESSILTSNGQTLQAGTILPTANYSAPSSPTICSGETVAFTNTSTNASSYYWIFENGSPATSTLVNPVISYSVSGTFDVTLHAIEGTDTNTIYQTITINLANQPLANFVSNSPIFLPNTAAFFTNVSTNASAYFWDFGDGNFSTDTNPWNDYGSTATYTVTLVAYNFICANDTSFQLVEVIDNVSISENETNNLLVYPNPFNDKIVISGLEIDEKISIKIFDQAGRIVATKNFISASSTIEIDNLNLLATGLYTIEIRQGEARSFYQVVKH